MTLPLTRTRPSTPAREGVVATVAAVADLAALFGIERGAVEDDDAVVARFGEFDGLPVLVDGENRGFVLFERFVAGEDRVGARVFEAGGHLELGAGAGGLALAGHGAAAVEVDLDVAFAADVARQVGGEAASCSLKTTSPSSTPSLEPTMAASRISMPLESVRKKRRSSSR